jgi:hypothetical protein
VLITHGRSERRMIGFGVAVAAAAARAGIPAAIGDAFRGAGPDGILPSDLLRAASLAQAAGSTADTAIAEVGARVVYAEPVP